MLVEIKSNPVTLTTWQNELLLNDDKQRYYIKISFGVYSIKETRRKLESDFYLEPIGECLTNILYILIVIKSRSSCKAKKKKSFNLVTLLMIINTQISIKSTL